MVGHKIITKYSSNDKLVFYPIPKNANTSIKMFHVQHLNLHEKFEYRDIPRYKRKLEKKQIKEIYIEDYKLFKDIDFNT